MTDPLVLRDPLPSGWRRCSSLGCGAPGGHEPPCVPEAVPPRPVAPAGRWMHRCRGNARCGLPEGHEGVHASVPEAPCTCEPDMQCYPCSGLVWQAAAAAVAVAGPEVDVAAELSATVSAKPIAVSATRYERIEAAAREIIAAREAFAASLRTADCLDAATARVGDAHLALRAALCSCSAHGPDPACVDHGAAIAAWQRENTP